MKKKKKKKVFIWVQRKKIKQDQEKLLKNAHVETKSIIKKQNETEMNRMEMQGKEKK